MVATDQVHPFCHGIKEYPILFSAEMIRAILDGRKTQTRRVVKPQPGGLDASWPDNKAICLEWGDVVNNPVYYAGCGYSPYGTIGDRLWVRETWSVTDYDWTPESFYTPPNSYLYRATAGDAALSDAKGHRWRPSIHMPRQASRISLELTGVRAERVRDISEDDAKAEGVQPVDVWDHDEDGNRYTFDSYYEGFTHLWDEINDKRGYGWEINPWVWVLEFKRL